MSKDIYFLSDPEPELLCVTDFGMVIMLDVGSLMEGFFPFLSDTKGWKSYRLSQML